jgi:PAS domain S-box-containing protein
MISYVKNQPEYFRCSKQFYYFIADLQGHISYSNPLFADLTTENFVEKIFSEKDNRSFLNAIQQCFRGRGPQSVKTSSPQVKWEVSLVVDDINNPEAVQAIGVNIDSNTINDQLHYQATILANVSDIIVTTDMGSKIKSWNRMAEMFYGIKEKIAIGQDVSDLLTLDYWPITRELMHKQLFEKGTWKGEVGFINPAGEKKYLLNTVSFVLNSDGERIGKLVFGKDITDRKQAEAKLRQSEQFYRNLFANSLDGILLTDESGKIYFSSSAVKMTLGYDIEEINGRNAFEFVHPEDHQKALAAFMNEVDESPEVKFILIRLLKKTGEYVWCNVRGHNLLNISNIGRIAIYLYDDSLRKQAEDALKESEQRFRNLVDNIQHGVILRDQNNKAIICNRAVLEIMGFEPAYILN